MLFCVLFRCLNRDFYSDYSSIPASLDSFRTTRRLSTELPRALPPVHRTVPRLTLPSPSNPQGLSYTTFNIVPVGIRGDDSASTSQALQTIDTQSELLRGSRGSDAGPPPTTYSVKVTNTGSVAGDEVVLAYLTKGCSDLPPPPDANASSQLFGFERVTLDAGASTVVTFNVTLRAVSYVSTARHRCSDHKRSP